MLAAQYKITLPSDYNMDIIINRVKNNGHKTDGFEGLDYKLYLITRKDENNNIQNSYSPFYLWKDSEGLNKFLFQGYYDNILSSFGWQPVNLGIPLINNTESDLSVYKYIFEIQGDITPVGSLNNYAEKIKHALPNLGTIEYLVIYNPDKWKYSAFYFLDDKAKTNGIKGITYDILYTSYGA